MSLVYKKGDALHSGDGLVIHGCNCLCTMGSGFAAQVHKECPNAWSADQRTLYGDKNKLGSFTYGVERSGMIVVNAYTQYAFTRTSVDLDYPALEESIRSIVDYFLRTYNVTVFSMPKIGCGLAGGDWNIVKEMLTDISEEKGVIFQVYEL